ncbi:MAG: hypothetical protein WBW13_08595 [Pseudolabrys sp.]|jgi:hypothetical protein
MTTLARRPLTLTLAERRAMLYSPVFWQVLGKGLSPFAGEQGQRLIASIARHNKISADRVQKHYCAYLRAYMAITDHLIHPGTETIN